MKSTTRTPFALNALLALATVLGAQQAAADTKDIVLDRLTTPMVSAQVARQPRAGSPVVVAQAPAVGDAMAVSILLETPDGTLTPKSTNTLFRTGDKFRVKLLASRDAKVSLYNTNPLGETNRTPLWQGDVRVGLDTVTPRMSLVGNAGIDQLHVVMEPLQEPTVFGWLGNWLRSFKDGGGVSKDIQLDVQNTPNTTYLVNHRSQGLVSTVQIIHTTH